MYVNVIIMFIGSYAGGLNGTQRDVVIYYIKNNPLSSAGSDYTAYFAKVGDVVSKYGPKKDNEQVLAVIYISNL